MVVRFLSLLSFFPFIRELILIPKDIYPCKVILYWIALNIIHVLYLPIYVEFQVKLLYVDILHQGPDSVARRIYSLAR